MLPIQRHSSVASAAYHDLVSLLLDDAASEIRGSPLQKTINGRHYWYDRYRVGDAVKDRYLGEDSDALKARIERHNDLKQASKARRLERARLTRLLRSERFLGLDSGTGSLILSLARAGVFRLGGVLVGTIAFRLYEGELGLRLHLDDVAMTRDIDIASFEKLSLALGDTALPTVSDVLRDLSFEAVPDLDRTKTWRWRQSKSQTLIEFLTPSFEEAEGIRELPALGVHAQSLHHLDYLIAGPIPAAAVYRDGTLVQVPRPERFAIHKLIVADRRKEGPESLKARKDLMQAERLIQVLAEDRPADLAEAYEDALARGGRWKMRVENSLKRAPEAAALLRALA